MPEVEAQEVEFQEHPVVTESPPTRSVMNLLSDLVLDLLDLLEIPKEQVNEELEASIEIVKTVSKAEELMVHLS